MSAGDAAPERATLTDEVCLADELGQVARAHPGGQRLPLRRRLEEGFGSVAGRSPGGGHDRMVARRPRLPAQAGVRTRRTR